MIHVACAADAAYLPHAAAMLLSLFAKHPGATAHLLHGANLPAAELEKLRRMCDKAGGTLRAHVIDDALVADLPEMGRISRVMWHRLFLPERLPDVARVLYLDCDTLVMDSLDPLFATDLGASALGAVANVFERGMEARIDQLKVKGYFNSGVLLMDLDAWRRERIAQAVLARARAGDLVWPDQDALNSVLDGRWLALRPRWNCQNSVVFFPQARALFGGDAVDEAVRNPAIVHFEGGMLAKPWHFLCKHPYRGEYLRLRAQTPWPDVELEGRRPLAYALRPLPLRWQIAALRMEERINRKLGASVNPLVSIIIPSFNQGRYLRATLDSIFAQDYRPLEVIVMDGGSKDETVAILTEYAAKHPELRFRSERDKGPADAVNKGLAEARGEFAGIQSSDDVYVPGAIREAVAELQRDATLGIVCADMEHVDAAGKSLAPMRPEPAFSHARLVARAFVIHQSSAFFRLALAKELGGWNAAYFCCDTDLWLRMSFRAGVKKVDRRWSERRMHPDQRDTQRRRMCEDWDRMIDNTPELKTAPLPLRLAARAGRHLIRLDYNPGVNAFGAAAHGWAAVLCYPPVLWHMTDPALLVPGLAGVRDRLFREGGAHA